MTVPPVTGVLIRAWKVPETLPAKYSVVAFEETGIVVNAVQAVPDPGNGSFVMSAFPGQHSMVTAPPVTDPLPVMRNVENLGSKKNWVNPTPVVATF